MSNAQTPQRCGHPWAKGTSAGCSPLHPTTVLELLMLPGESSQGYSYPEDIEIYGLFIKILI